MRKRFAFYLLATVLIMQGYIRAAAIGTAFSYTGNLEAGGGPVTDTCDFRFGLWDAAEGGNQTGSSPQTMVGVEVTDGIFTTPINFGGSAIDGTARWLAIEVQCPGDPNFTLLTPRVALAPAPHALALPGLYTQQNATSPNVVGGFHENIVTAGAVGATISGGGISGSQHLVTDNFGTIGGGEGNQAGDNSGSVSSAGFATVGGGKSNLALRPGSTVGGGIFNFAIGEVATVAGGSDNHAEGTGSTVSGGQVNVASGNYTSIPGGQYNTVLGSFSFAGGRGALASFPGMFVWSDISADPLLCPFPAMFEGNFAPASNQFLARVAGGAVFVTSTSSCVSTSGVQLASGGGSWSSFSDRNSKTNLATVNPLNILDRLSEIPISTWSYKSQDESIRHIGPMAQDFHAAFGVGENEKFITSIDAEGVALAAIQGLHQLVNEKDCEIGEMGLELSNFKSEISDLHSEISELREMVKELQKSNEGTRQLGKKDGGK